KHLKISVTLSFLFCTVLVFSQPYAQPNKMEYALQAIKYAYVDTINEKKITDDAIRAMVKDLDPHSVYIPVDEMREMNEPLVGKFEGIGIQFNILEDTIMVTQTIP